MPQRKRTQAHLEAEQRYRSKTKAVRLVFHKDKDIETIEWLRSQVSTEDELPGLIRSIIEEKRTLLM